MLYQEQREKKVVIKQKFSGVNTIPLERHLESRSRRFEHPGPWRDVFHVRKE